MEFELKVSIWNGTKLLLVNDCVCLSSDFLKLKRKNTANGFVRAFSFWNHLRSVLYIGHNHASIRSFIHKWRQKKIQRFKTIRKSMWKEEVIYNLWQEICSSSLPLQLSAIGGVSVYVSVYISAMSMIFCEKGKKSFKIDSFQWAIGAGSKCVRVYWHVHVCMCACTWAYVFVSMFIDKHPRPIPFISGAQAHT